MSRIERLKEKLFRQDEKAIFLERLIFAERAYQKYKGYPPTIRYALIFEEILSNISIVIDKDDLIVGRVREVIPTSEEERLFLEKASENNFSSLKLFSIDPLNLIDIVEVGPRYAPEWFNAWGHLTISWETLLKKGFAGIKALAEKKLGEIKFKSSEDEHKKQFLESVIICCDSMIHLGQRHAKEAERLAGKEENEDRRNELLTIKQICEHVPAYPARNFWEELQSIWFTHMVLHTICGARDYALGRFDQYMYPLYEHDIKSGCLPEEQAFELLACFFIKLNEIIGLGVENYTPKRILSVNSLQYLILGGQTLNGDDASNSLSSLVLEVAKKLRLKQPTLTVRYFRGINREFWRKACSLIKEGLGYPGVYNDETVIPAVQNLGIPSKDAINYVHYGCCNPNIPGKEGELRECWHNLVKYLELTLNNGFCMLSGRQMGPETGDPAKLDSFDKLLGAFRNQVRYWVRRATEIMYESDKKWRKIKPFSFESCLLKDCVEKAKDCILGGTSYAHLNHHGVGVATLANSLVAIKKLVYENGRFSLAELREILKSNFKGHEKLRPELLNKFPKFGNDDDVVDSIAARVGRIFCEEILSCPALDRRWSWPDFYSLWHHREMGKYTAASADGRRAGEPLSENQSSSYGTDKKGPTALLNSLSRLPFKLTPGGGLNIKIHPTALKGQKGIDILCNLIESYFLNGGMQVQLNVIDKKTLLDAKGNPEKYRSLTVRVVGYSAYFVTLSPEQQDEIIDRTEL